jgi:glutathione-specific gamma-glutamylcyclotransferase
MPETVGFESTFPVLPEDARRRSLHATVAARPKRDCVWLFGYGSLMWEELAPAAERRRARLDGWHRALCVWSALARGRPERPGLCLGLDAGGSAEGVALRVEGPGLETLLAPVWHREMWTDVYRPEWVDLATAEGPIEAVAFVAEVASRQYVSGLDDDQIARLIAGAGGERGSCRDYLAQAVERLHALGISEPDLEAMLARVDALSPSGR